MLSDFMGFLLALWVYWYLLVGGGVSFALDIWERSSDRQVRRKIVRVVWVGCIFVACFLAWRDEHAAREQADGRATKAETNIEVVAAQRDAAQAAALQAQQIVLQMSVTHTSDTQTDLLRRIAEALVGPESRRPAGLVASPASARIEPRLFQVTWSGEQISGLPTIRITMQDGSPVPSDHAVVLMGVRAWSELERRFIDPPMASLFAPALLGQAPSLLQPLVRVADNLTTRGSENQLSPFIGQGGVSQWQLILRVVHGAYAELYEEARLCFHAQGPLVKTAQKCSA